MAGQTEQEISALNFGKGLVVSSSDGLRTPITLWANPTTHRLLVDAGTITAASPSVSLTGAAVPTSADYIGFNVGGNLTGISAANPLPVSGSFSLTNPTVGAAVPATANYIAGNNGGNLTGLLIGQQTMANSLAVVLASNQASIPVTIAAGAAVIGHVISDSGSVVAATLSAETTKVIGTINIAASQTVGLVAGSAIIGKVTTDQTTHGTTDLVAADITKVGGTSFALGQQIASASLPIVLTAAQISTLTPLASVTVTQATGSNLHTVIDSGTITTITNALPTGSNVIGHVISDSGSTTVVTGTVATAEVAPTTVLNGKTTVTTAGTRVVLASTTAAKSVTIKALSTNTGIIYVGSSTVASTNGFQLAAGDSVSLDIANLNTVNIDSSVNGEGVTYIGVN